MNTVFHLFQLERPCLPKFTSLKPFRDFLCGTVVKTPSFPAGSKSLILGWGIKKQTNKNKNPSTLSIGTVRLI